MNKNIVKLIAILVMCFMLVSVLVACKGETGPKGDKGEQGIQGVAGKDGTNGKDGQNGKDGVDYVLTDADKQEIANMVIDIIPSAEGASF